MPSQQNGVWKSIWGLESPPKMKHFLWKACKNILLVKERLLHRHICSSASCSICEDPSESILHALFDCPRAKTLWEPSTLHEVVMNAPDSSFMERYKWLAGKLKVKELREACAIMWA